METVELESDWHPFWCGSVRSPPRRPIQTPAEPQDQASQSRMVIHLHRRPSNKRHLPLSAFPTLICPFQVRSWKPGGATKAKTTPLQHQSVCSHVSWSETLCVAQELIPPFHHPTTLGIQPGGPIHPPRPPSSASRLPPSGTAKMVMPPAPFPST